jgi:hypothetical protein
LVFVLLLNFVQVGATECTKTTKNLAPLFN